jgi:hypothetical protein
MMRHLLLTCAFLIAVVPIRAAEPPKVTVNKTATAIEFFVGDELVTRYNIAAEVAKPYFWPVNAPGAVPVTRGWPMQAGLLRRPRTTCIKNRSGSATAT